ncbi:MAG: hypothetical protein WCP66_07215 [Methylococcales bacterium]
MKRSKPVFDFAQYPMSEKVTFFRHVNDQLFGNPLYPTPDITFADAKAAVDTLEAAILAAKHGGATAVSAMHDAAERADMIYKTLAHYVERTAAGDETSILSSGFHISKQPVLTPKSELTAFDGEHSGGVRLVAKALLGAVAYLWQMAIDDGSGTGLVWIAIGSTTRATFEMNGLEIMKRYKFRFAAVTPAGTTDYCEPVTKIIV